MVCSAWKHAAVSYETGAEVASCAEHKVKRAGYKHGIGRELYTAPFIWIDAADCNLKQSNGKWQCFDSFSVTHMLVEDGRIKELQIVNDKTRKIVYPKGNAPRQASPKAPSKPVPNGMTDEVKAELRQIANQIGNDKAVFAAYKANGIEGARALLSFS